MLTQARYRQKLAIAARLGARSSEVKASCPLGARLSEP